MGCATGVVKYVVFIANLVFALAGLVLLGIGIFYKVNYTEVTNALPDDFGLSLAPILCIIVGAVVFITAFLGCCGAVKESPCMLTTYAIILLTIFIIQVAIGVYAFIKIKDADNFHNAVENSVEKLFNKYRNNPNNEPEQEVVFLFQRLLECCGSKHPDEMRLANNSFPLSCCKQGVAPCSSTSTYFYNTPCGKQFSRFLENSSQIIGGVVIGIAVVELHCCGAKSPDEYAGNRLPKTCCMEGVTDCLKTDPVHVYHDNCSMKLENFIRNSSKIIGGVVIGISIAELIGAFFGLCLASSIRNQYRRSMYA